MSKTRKISVQDLVLRFEEKCKLSKTKPLASYINANSSNISRSGVKLHNQEQNPSRTKEIVSDWSEDVRDDSKNIIEAIDSSNAIAMSDNKTIKSRDYKLTTLQTIKTIEDEYVNLDSLREMRQTLQNKVKPINVAMQINNNPQSETSSENDSNRSSSSQDDVELYSYHMYENIFTLNANQRGCNESENSDQSNISTPDNTYDYVTITKYDLISNAKNQKKSSSALHYKTLLTVCDEQKTTQTEISKVKHASGHFENEEVHKYKDKKEYIVDELITSEGTYISNLKLTLYRYPDEISRTIGSAKTKEIFSELDNILNGSISLLRAVDKVRKEYDLIGQIFLDHRELFELYPIYCKNKTRSEKLCRMYSRVIESIEKKYEDRLGLSSHLLLPIQRLAKYVLLLNKLTKELIKNNLPADRVKSAADLIHNITHKGNDLVELNSIFGKAYELTDTGNFLMRDNFRMITPKKSQVTLFLFQHKIIITVRDKYRQDNYFYFMDINMSELSLSSEEYNKTTFSVSNAKKHEFKMNTKNPAIKARWVIAIEKILWEELEKERRKIIKLYNSDNKNQQRIPTVQ